MDKRKASQLPRCNNNTAKHIGLIGGILYSGGRNSGEKSGSFGFTCKCNKLEAVQKEKSDLEKMNQKMSEFISDLEKDIDSKQDEIRTRDLKFDDMERTLKDQLYTLRDERDQFEQLIEKINKDKEMEELERNEKPA